MKFNTRELVTLAVFGALWGVVEVSLGSLLHVLNVPLTGLFMTAVGIAIALVGRLYVPKPGATVFIGLIAALLKMFSLGGIVINPMIGIIAASLLAEIVLTAFRRPRRLAFVLAGGLAVLWTLVHPFLTQSFLAGRGVLVIWLDLLDEGIRLFGLNSNAAWVIVAALVLLRL
ncbi:MAG TPA: ECF transporter S component, partial [Chloroflexi bacterium]|nr:ECF transporter S component [Chloroflexota bacterium]